MRSARLLPVSVAMLTAACGAGEGQLTLRNQLQQAVGLEVRAPLETLTGGCEMPFRDRFCAEEYEIIGVLDFAAGEGRDVTISDAVNDERCTNQLWLRLVWLGAPDMMPVGPAADPGTLLALPAEVDVQDGAGALHAVAFPGQTVRLDERGGQDAMQALPPQTCAEQGRAPRS